MHTGTGYMYIVCGFGEMLEVQVCIHVHQFIK